MPLNLINISGCTTALTIGQPQMLSPHTDIFCVRGSWTPNKTSIKKTVGIGRRRRERLPRQRRYGFACNERYDDVKSLFICVLQRNGNSSRGRKFAKGYNVIPLLYGSIIPKTQNHISRKGRFAFCYFIFRFYFKSCFRYNLGVGGWE